MLVTTRFGAHLRMSATRSPSSFSPWHVAALLAAAVLPFQEASAQQYDVGRRPATTATVLAGNMLIAGLTATTRALLEGKDARKAFIVGLVGGAVHVSGKFVGTGRTPPSALAGSMISAVGTAIVSNGGAGKHPLDELHIPVAMLRVRLTPSATDKVRIAVNAFETAVLARHLARDGLVIDWRRSASIGTFVFNTRNKDIILNGQRVGGVTTASVVVVSEFARDPARTMRHEAVHVQQQWFMQEAWGRPAEELLRKRIPKGKWVPRWLEPGVLVPIFSGGEDVVFGNNGPLTRLMQAEADMFERR